MAEYQTPPRKATQPGAAETAVLKFLDNMEDESKTVEKELKNQWESNLGWFRGQQWLLRNRAPLFTANKIGQIIRKKQARLTEMKPQFQVMSRRSGLTTTEAVIQKTIDAGWDEYNVQMVLEDLASHMCIYGAGFLHIPWDSSADYGEGDIIPGCLDPRYVHIDPALQYARDLDNASYIWTSSYMDTWTIRQRWPGRGSLVETAEVRGSQEGESLNRHIRRMFGAWRSGRQPVPEALPRSEVKEYWFKDPTIGEGGRLLYPHGRHVVRGGARTVLIDEPNPYHDERWPFVMVDGIADPEHPWGQSEIQALRRIQDAVNRIGHMFVENTILTGNTWITTDKNALEPTTMQRLSNIGAIIIEKAVGRNVERETPPPMPAHMMGFIEIALRLMDELSGLSDTTAAAQGRVEVRSEEQLEGLQQATEVLIRAMARRLESGLERFGHRWIARIFQFYTRNRILTHLGPTLEWKTFEFERDELLREIYQTAKRDAAQAAQEQRAVMSEEQVYRDATRRAWRHFMFRVTPGSSLASVRANRAALHASLAQQGMLSRKHVLRDLGYPNPEEEIDEAQREAALLNGASQAGGEPPQGIRQAV